MAEETGKMKLAKASVFTSEAGYTSNGFIGNYPGKPLVPGYYDNTDKLVNADYHEDIKKCRFYYRFDPIASTVINRMSDMAITDLRHRKRTNKSEEEVDNTTYAFFEAVGAEIKPMLKMMAVEYLLHGMVIPDYTLDRVRGDELVEALGRKRVWVPKGLWLRNPSHIRLKRKPGSHERNVFYKVPKEEVEFIRNKGMLPNGEIDTITYNLLAEQFGDYVEAIQKGRVEFLITDDVKPIYRKLTSYDDYPQPFLLGALSALEHKAYLKTMDKSIASRVIEAIRLFKTGDKDHPAEDDDIKALKAEVLANSSTGERVWNFFTNHTVTVEWIIPDMAALLDEAKYAEPNADIFLGMGFPRILVSGETLRSNSSDSSIASLGPVSTLEDMREGLLRWVENLYKELAQKNGFKTYPKPYFAPIQTTDVTALVQFAIQAMTEGAISKNTVAELYGKTYDQEADQIAAEQALGVLSPKEQQVERQFEQQEHMSNLAMEAQQKAAKEEGKNNNSGDKNEKKSNNSSSRGNRGNNANNK